MVQGKEKGKTVRYSYRLYDRERRSVYAAAAIGTQMLALGEIEGKGVLAPEAIEDSKRIIDRLAHKGFNCEELREEITEIILK